MNTLTVILMVINYYAENAIGKNKCVIKCI